MYTESGKEKVPFHGKTRKGIIACLLVYLAPVIGSFSGLKKGTFRITSLCVTDECNIHLCISKMIPTSEMDSSPFIAPLEISLAEAERLLLPTRQSRSVIRSPFSHLGPVCLLLLRPARAPLETPVKGRLTAVR